jgi:hypothetical protein
MSKDKMKNFGWGVTITPKLNNNQTSKLREYLGAHYILDDIHFLEKNDGTFVFVRNEYDKGQLFENVKNILTLLKLQPVQRKTKSKNGYYLLINQ